MIYVESEDQRISATVSFIKSTIEELDREIRECDYEEDPDGNLVYSPNCYSYEKDMFKAEKRNLKTIQELLTREIPFSLME